MRWTASHVVHLARSLFDLVASARHQIHEVPHEKQVPHLFPVAINRKSPSSQSGQREVRHPSLVFRTKLVRPVNARHPEHDRRQPVDAMVVANVLIRRALRTTIRRMKVQRASPRHAIRKILEFVPRRTLDNPIMFQPAVNFIRRRVEESWHRLLPPGCFEHVHRSLRVDRKILLRICDRSRHRHLRGQMKHRLRPFHRLFHGAVVSHVTLHELYPLAVLPPKPVEILLHAGAADVVEQNHLMPLAQQPIRQIRADKSNPAGNQGLHDASNVLAAPISTFSFRYVDTAFSNAPRICG